MKRWETIRGHGGIDRLYTGGRRLDAGMIRCLYRVTEESPATLRVVFAVSSRVFNAVRRNRIKRLMREAFSREVGKLRADLMRARRSASLLFVFRGAKGLQIRSLRLDEVRDAMTLLCSGLRSTLG